MNHKVVIASVVGGLAVYVALAYRHQADVKHPSTGALASLADPTPVAKADSSGTRLKAKTIVGDDGSKLYLSDVMFDSMLGVDCVFKTAADGTLRCLPVVPFGWDLVAYSDAACTKREVIVGPPAPGCPANPAKYVYVYDAPALCADSATVPPAHVYPVGAFLGTVGYAYEGPSCQGQGMSGSQIAYALGAEVPATSFAAATTGFDP